MNYAEQVLTEVRRAIVGKDDMILKTFLTMLAGGHLLLEDKPGVGKTTLALAFSRALQLDYKRMQFTPDVMPTDVTGFTIYNKHTGNNDYQKGAILCNLFLADELNRASSRTQAALLEAMEEGQVTVDGVTHPIPKPFIVIATQNPTGAAGTQLLPDSQMDRFTVRLSVGYPKPNDERDMVLTRQGGVNPLEQVNRVVTREELLRMQQAVSRVYLKDTVVNYIVALIQLTRQHSQIARGASPRATLAVAAMAKATAVLNGRDYVLPEDVKTVFAGTVAHRLLLTPEAKGLGLSETKLLTEILGRVPAPQV